MSADYSGIVNAFTSFLKPWIIILWAIAILFVIIAIVKRILFRRKLKKIVENAEECTVDEFFTIKSSANDFVGVYVLYNKTKDMFYVGQSKNVYKRVSNHLNGKGNGDVYADFKYGNHFTIRVIPLAGSGYTSLNQLERHYIDYYKAFSKGYNKNRGNKD